MPKTLEDALEKFLARSRTDLCTLVPVGAPCMATKTWAGYIPPLQIMRWVPLKTCHACRFGDS
jgi:hypothetical protein